MSLQQWLDNSWINKTDRSGQEVSNLLDIAERQIADASLPGMSADGRFAHAYEAVRCLCELALHATGYTVLKGMRQHERVIESLKFTLQGEWTETADFFDRCRRFRHQVQYERSGVVQHQDADELLAVAEKLHDAVQEWLQQRHPDLL